MPHPWMAKYITYCCLQVAIHATWPSRHFTESLPVPLANVQVSAFGFIIAPMVADYLQSGGRATECLVTTVAKVDLGGWLSRRSLLGRLLAITPLARYTTDVWLRPLVNRVITLRDMVRITCFAAHWLLVVRCSSS
jgi:hypothetical protein